jgi:hypothetical protein
MTMHETNKELVAKQKAVGCTEGEATVAARGLHELAEDPEVTSQALKGECIKLQRELAMNIGKTEAREQTMARALSLVNRIS